MYLEEITLTNFRGFKNYTLKLKQFNVLIGKNSCGKTTILQAIQLVYDAINSAFELKLHDEPVLNNSPEFVVFKPSIELPKTISHLGLSDIDHIYYGKNPGRLQIMTKWSNSLWLNIYGSSV
jgi:energy-coupling factor transporter ATP-binding protein EcfA2